MCRCRGPSVLQPNSKTQQNQTEGRPVRESHSTAVTRGCEGNASKHAAARGLTALPKETSRREALGGREEPSRRRPRKSPRRHRGVREEGQPAPQGAHPPTALSPRRPCGRAPRASDSSACSRAHSSTWPFCGSKSTVGQSLCPAHRQLRAAASGATLSGASQSRLYVQVTGPPACHITGHLGRAARTSTAPDHPPATGAALRGPPCRPGPGWTEARREATPGGGRAGGREAAQGGGRVGGRLEGREATPGGQRPRGRPPRVDGGREGGRPPWVDGGREGGRPPRVDGGREGGRPPRVDGGCTHSAATSRASASVSPSWTEPPSPLHLRTEQRCMSGVSPSPRDNGPTCPTHGARHRAGKALAGSCSAGGCCKHRCPPRRQPALAPGLPPHRDPG